MAESRSGDAERPTVEQPAPLREPRTLVGLPGEVPPSPSPPPPPLPVPHSAPGVPPPLPAVPMDPVVGVALRTVVLVAVLAALAGAAVASALFLVFG